MASTASSHLPEIKEYMLAALQRYQKLRGGDSSVENGTRGTTDVNGHFWDTVVLTACDKEQAWAFSLQLESKKKRQQLPSADYLVVADAAELFGCKIGAGGSTLIVIRHLREKYAQELENKKILLIHAGGWSQRLPSATVLGKLFMPLPLGGFDFDMLDLKLAIYLPFIPLMEPGIFLTASDDIEIFAMDSLNSSSLTGFVALGHPSSLAIGRTHGVYVCDTPPDAYKSRFLNCQRVLQKPTEGQMREVGAVVSKPEDEEYVISDSAFWFDMDILRKLERFHEMNGLHPVEVDAYGDFLQPLGAKSTKDYIQNTKNPDLQKAREDLYNLLRDAPLHVLYLPKSVFIHLGTMPEFLDNLLVDKIFRSCFEISSTVIRSVMHDSCDISPKAVLEFCDFSVPVQVGQNCFISCCSTPDALNGSKLDIPDGTFMHTVILQNGGRQEYATIFCGVNDDLKAEASVNEMGKLKIFGKSILEFFEGHLPKTPGDSDKISLWSAKIFPVFSTPGDSFLYASQTVASGKLRISDSRARLVSMADVLRHKDVDAMIVYRKCVVEKVRHASLEKTAQRIFTAGVDAVKPMALITDRVKVDGDTLRVMDFGNEVKYACAAKGSFWILAVGKASLGMYEGLVEVLGQSVRGAAILLPCEMLEILTREAHPLLRKSGLSIVFGGSANLPNTSSLESTEKILAFLQSIQPPATLFCAISGGASAMLVAPRSPVTLAEKLSITKMLMSSGAPIEELNAVRGALSDVKAGGLLRYVHRDISVCSVILSDIIPLNAHDGDPVHLVGSGPTITNVSGTADAKKVLIKHRMWESAPESVRQVLTVPFVSQSECECTNVLVGKNSVALEACTAQAKLEGFYPINLTRRLHGISRDAGAAFCDLVRQVHDGNELDLRFFEPATGAPFALNRGVPLCFLAGGETVVRLTGSGKGGRNQEMVLAFVMEFQKAFSKKGDAIKGAFLSGGTDGQDGPTDAAGAVCHFDADWSDEELLIAAEALQNNDSYTFWQRATKHGSLVKTGLTGTNVMDVQVLLKSSQQ